MNKKGYTLAEALITLGIIGIIAALVVPAANKARPNQNKIKFLQTYDTIETQIKNFAQNSRYFPTCQDFPDPDNPGQTIRRCFPDYPLYNTSGGVADNRLDANGNPIPILISTPGVNPPDRPLPDGYIAANNGQQKLCYLLADAMGTTTPMANRCQGNYPNAPDFVTPNGIAFGFEFNDSWFDLPEARNGDTFFLMSVVFDVNGDLSQANVGGENPSTFIIAITADGSVYPNDSASIAYLENRNDTREKFNNRDFARYATIDLLNNPDSKARVIFSN